MYLPINSLVISFLLALRCLWLSTVLTNLKSGNLLPRIHRRTRMGGVRTGEGG